MLNYDENWNTYAQTMGIPTQMQPIMMMPEQQLTAMYPKCYNIIYPQIMRQCDIIDASNGPMNVPTNEQMERAVDDIVNKVEKDVDAVLMNEYQSAENRQLGYGGRRILRDLAGILLIRELIQRRRRPPYYGYPGYGYGPGLGIGYGGFLF
jgi:hypothetical protein